MIVLIAQTPCRIRKLEFTARVSLFYPFFIPVHRASICQYLSLLVSIAQSGGGGEGEGYALTAMCVDI